MGVYTRVAIIVDGSNIDASDVENEFNAILQAVNNIEDVNVKSGANIDADKLKDDTILDAKINSAADIDGSKLKDATVDDAKLVAGGWHGSKVKIKITPGDFVTNHIDFFERINDDGGSVIIGGTVVDLIATVVIPTGYKATVVTVSANPNRDVEVFECQLSNANTTSKGTGTTAASIDITDVHSTVGNYLSIVVKDINTATVYGGSVTIEKV